MHPWRSPWNKWEDLVYRDPRLRRLEIAAFEGRPWREELKAMVGPLATRPRLLDSTRSLAVAWWHLDAIRPIVGVANG